MTSQAQAQAESFVLENRLSAEQRTEETTAARDSNPIENPRPKWLYLKIISAGISYFMAGVNDGSLGSLIPYAIRSYAIDTNMVAIL